VSGVPRDPEETWAEFCFQAASHYRDDIHHWEVWNEPNLPHFWAGSSGEYIYKILLPASAAIHTADPRLGVGGPALAHVGSWYRWLPKILAHASEDLDFLTHHAYGSDARQVTKRLEKETLFRNVPCLWWLVKPSLADVVLKTDHQRLPVWLTETGWASDQIGEERQAANYTGLLTEYHLSYWPERFFFYELQDDPGPGIPAWGILRADGSEKLAYGAYRDVALGE
jgi:hypothetical protein